MLNSVSMSFNESGISPLKRLVRSPSEYGPDGMKLAAENPFVDHRYGPDGFQLDKSDVQTYYGEDGMLSPVIDGSRQHGEEVSEEGAWYQADSGRTEQAARAQQSFAAIVAEVDKARMAAQDHNIGWTNDPDVFPLPFPDVVPFPPNNRQLYVPNPQRSHNQNKPTRVPRYGPDGMQIGEELHEEVEMVKEVEDPANHHGSDHQWSRLLSYGFTSGLTGSAGCAVFDNYKKGHCGRVYQGELDNAYLVEALNAISLRPKLAAQLFHAWDVNRSVYVLRLFKNGIWVKVEVDDYIPASMSREGEEDTPFCCRSEHFPSVLWPSLVEKAYAKSCTLRHVDARQDSGGWGALGGGGRVEEALVDLTGGVAGCFSTRDVAPDRLFVYFHELQRYCLFVCRVHTANCIKNGVNLNAFAHHALNRAAHFEGGCYVQIFCSSENGTHNGGLQDLSVPDAILNGFPEKLEDGFFWLSIYDFHLYFDVIYECRLTNSPDVGIDGMPQSRLPNAMSNISGIPGMPPSGKLPQSAQGAETSWRFRGSDRPLFSEWVYANAGTVSEHRPPEFKVDLPEAPCEIVAVVEQTDTRITQVGPYRKPHVPILVKVYQHIEGDVYSSELVCKSHWLPVRNSMVSFKSSKGGSYKIIAEFPRQVCRCERLIFRCYASQPFVRVSAGVSLHQHYLAKPEEPALAIKWSFVGCVDPKKLERGDQPEPLPDEDLDAMKDRYRSSDGSCPTM